MKKLSAEEYKIKREKYLASLSPEEREELERKKREAEAESRKSQEEFSKQHEELFKWLENGMKTNERHEKAIKAVLEALRTTANHQDMTPEIKNFVETLIIVIEDRKLFEYNLEAIMHPLIEIVEEDTKSKAGSNAGSAPKKPEGKAATIKLWKEWCNDPALFKNKTKFVNFLVSDKNKTTYCDSLTTANGWFKEIRHDFPNTTLEKILPKRK